MMTLSGEPVTGAPADGQYKYAAFISYRHQPPDRDVAAWLVKALETYRVPARLRAQRKLPRRIGRIFRDEEEMPTSASLSDQINDALETSKFLIVVCSPRLKHSQWCREEIRRFHAMGRTERILPVIVEGEPNDVGGASDPFVTELRDWEYTRRSVGDDGRPIEERVRYEPIAADLRPKAGQSASRRRHVVRLKLLAGLLGCDFEELFERDRRRRRRRTIQWAAAVLLTLGLVGVLSAVAVRQTRGAQWARHVELSQRLADVSIGSREQLDPETRTLLALLAHRVAERAQQTQAVPQDNWTRVERALRQVAGGDASVVDLRLPAGFTALLPAPAERGSRVAVGAVEGPTPDLSRMSPEVAATVRGAVFLITAERPPRVDYQWHVQGVPVWAHLTDDGRRIVAATNDGTVHTWTLAQPSAAPTRIAPPQFAPLTSVISPDGRTLAYCHDNGAVSFVPVDAAANVTSAVGTLGPPPDGAHFRGAMLRFSGDGRLLGGCWRRADTVSVWDAAGAGTRPPRQLRCAGLRVASIHFANGSEHLLAVSADGALVRWNLSEPNPEPVIEVDGQYTDTIGVANSDVDADGRRLLVQTISAHDGLVYDLLAPEAGPHVLSTPESRTAMLHPGALLADGRVVTADGNRLRFWSLNSGLMREPVMRLAALQLGNVAGSSGLNQLSPDMAALVGRMNIGRFWGVGFSPDGKTAYTAALAGVPPSPALWRWALDPNPAATPQVMFKPDAAALANIAGGLNFAASWGGRPFDVSTDGRLVAAAWGNGIIVAQTGAPGDPATIRGKGGAVHAVRFEPGPTDKGVSIATGGEDGRVEIRTIRSSGGVDERQLAAGAKPIRSIAYSPDGRLLVAGDDGGAVRLWRTSELSAPPRVIQERAAARVGALTFAAGGSLLVTAGGKELKLWDVSGGREAAALATLSMQYDVTSLAAAPDGRCVAIGMSQSPGADLSQTRGLGMLSLLDVAARRARSVPEELPGVTHVAVSPDGRFLLAACEDLMARTMILNTSDLVAAAESAVARNLSRDEWEKYVQGALSYEPVVPSVPVPSQ